MKNYVFVILLMMFPSAIWAQTELSNDSIETIQKLFAPKLGNEQLNNYLQMDKPVVLEFDAFKPDYQPRLDALDRNRKIDIPAFETDYFPVVNISPTNIYMPLGNNYSLSAAYPVADDLFISTYSGSTEYLGLGGIRRVDAQLGYQPTDWMMVSAGPYVSKFVIFGYGSNTINYDDYGLSGTIRFKATERIRFNVYGQYGGTSRHNKIDGPMSSMFNPSYYGGTVEFKINDNFGIEAGMLRELNPFTGKWVNKPIIAPVIYAGKKRK